MSVYRTIILILISGLLPLAAQTSVPTLSKAIPGQGLVPGRSAVTLALTDYFTVPGISGQVVVFDTVLGKVGVELRADAAPLEVSNFLSYVSSGAYSSSFIHRSAALETNGAISIIQGGGYVMNTSGITNVEAKGTVPLEYNLPNERGTLAAARATDVNSATCQWYFNVRDNSSILGPSNGGGYTVFGRVIGTGMSIVDAVAALPRVNAGSPFNELPVRDYTSGTVYTANLVMVNSIRALSLFPDNSGSSWVSFAVENSASGIVSATLNGTALTLTPLAAGTAQIVVRATDVNGNTASSTFTVTVTPVAPTISVQPAAQTTVATGNTAVLNATVIGASAYQWQRNGAEVVGATDATLVIRPASAANAGTYTLLARNSTGTTTSSPAIVSVVTVTAKDVGRLTNLSIRSNAGTGDRILTVGFTLGGAGTSGSAPLLLRASGPALIPFHISDVLPDPVATLYSGKVAIATNDNWGNDPAILARAKSVGAFDFDPAGLDAALAASPAAGGYTMQVTGKGNATGNALAEIYEATKDAFTATTPRLINLSARTQVETGDAILTAGLVVGGTTARTVLIRASGPELGQFDVSGTLVDPRLQLFRQGETTPLATNEDWGGSAQLATVGDSVGAFGFKNLAGKDAALLITLPPGNYSAQVSGADGGTGIALVEVYEIP